MPLYPEFPNGVLSPGFLQSSIPLAPGPAPVLTNRAPMADPFSQTSPASTTTDAKRPGLLGRIQQQPGGSKALIALGASLLSNQNFFEGLGQGAMAYQQTLDAEQARLDPTPNKDGTFTTRRDPQTGELIYERTPVADFEEQQANMRLLSAQAIAKIRDNGDTDRLQTTMGFRDRWETADDEFEREKLAKQDEWNAQDNATDVQIAKIQGANSWREAQLRINPGASGKPPPVGIQKEISSYTDTRNAQQNAIQQIEPILGAIERGDLHFDLPSNLRHKAAIATGIGGNAETVFYAQYQTSLESLRNALLVANKGVQTDGDAERAMAELIAGGGNTQTIRANLAKVINSLRTRTGQAQNRIDELARQYGADNRSSSPAATQAPAQQGRTNGVRWRKVQ